MTKLNDFISRFQFTLPVTRQTQRTASKSAAVLLPIINKKTPTLLLTQRSPFLRSHAGQVAFPGGASDPEDGSLITTALREAYEEVAIPPEKVQILGQLTPQQSLGGYEVTPLSDYCLQVLTITLTLVKLLLSLKCLYLMHYH